MIKPATIAVSVVALSSVLGALAPPAAAQMMRGYSFPARNPGLAAQYQYLRSQENGGTVESGGIGAFNQYVTTTTTNSQSIGNMNTNTIAAGASGAITNTGDQASNGSQSASSGDANMDLSATNSGNVDINTEQAGQIADIIEETLE